MEFSDSTEVFFKDNPQRRFDFKSGFALAVAVVFCFLLLTACIVLAFLYSHELGKPPEVSFLEKNSSSEKVHVEKYEICDKDECFHLGQVMVHNMNKSVDPCEDFYAYACGGWQQRHPLKNNATSSTTWDKVRGENIEVLEKALGWAHKNYSKNEAVMKMARVYKSCLNTFRIEILGLKPLNDLIQEYGGWTISQNYDPNVTITQRMGRAARDLNVDTLLGMDVRPNIYNTSINVLMLKESSLGLDKGDYLNPDANSQKKRKEYKDYMKTVSRIFHVPYAKMKAIYEFEVKLAKIVSGKSLDAALKDHIRKIAEQTRTRRNTYDGTIKLTKLCQETGFPWAVLKEYLDVLFDREFTGDERIQPYSIDKAFLKAISPLYKETDHTLLADYIMWQVVRQYVGALPDRYRSSTPTRMDILGFPGYWWYRWYQCIHAMLKPFDMPLGLLFVEAVNFNNDDKVKIRDMIENVRTSFIQELSSQTWMDKPTQKKAKEKALAMVVEDIGYPSYIKDPAKLKAQYESLTVTNSLMDNLKAANHFYRMRTLNKFQRPVDKKEWSSGNPIEDNDYYFPSSNKIAFLAGDLRKPMYSTGYPRYINYGYTGCTIGHEITHGFDNEGHLYDKNGDFNVWWSASSEANFESKSKCFVKQYNKFKVFDKYVNGTKTLGDNIADNGGIKLAYDAYQRWTKRNGTEKILPGFNLSPNQLFFVAYAQTWCSVYNKEGAYKQLATDEHATGKYRVIGPLSNFKKFSEVFKCPPKSGMNPVNKCELW